MHLLYIFMIRFIFVSLLDLLSDNNSNEIMGAAELNKKFSIFLVLVVGSL